MKISRSYAKPGHGVNLHHVLHQLIELEIQKFVDNKEVNSPTSHSKIAVGGDCL